MEMSSTISPTERGAASQHTAREAPVVEVPDDDDGVLDYTLRQRQTIIVTIAGAKGENLNGLSARELDVMLAALDGMDRVALGRKRLRSENMALARQAEAAAIIARVLGAPGIAQAGQQLLLRTGASEGPAPFVPATAMLPASVPEPVLVPGETDMDAAQMNVDTFMAGFGSPA
jgi:hypothetical protein